MKKTSVISINLKFLRIPMAMTFFILLIVCVQTGLKKLPSIHINNNFSGFFLSTHHSLKTEQASLSPVFSLLRTKAVAPSQTFETKEISDDTQLTVPTPAATSVAVKKAELSPVAISNTTKLKPDIQKCESFSPDFLKGDFSVLIVHTHTTESYASSENYSYTPSDRDRTTDKSFNMVKIGAEVEKVLKENGIKVYHDTTINDYPSYSGSYSKSGANVQNHIANDSSIKVVLDIHRDAIERKNGEKVKYVCDTESGKAAKIMFVVGSNQSGLKHDNWETNLGFAYKLQQHITSIYPNLMRPLNFRSQRFNQQLSPGAIIVEVGTNGNTLEEALTGARCFAQGMADYIKKGM